MGASRRVAIHDTVLRITLTKWYNYPLRYMIDRVETSNMSLQAMLGSQQAQLMHKNRNDNRENTKI